jgi:hypothetical protein
MPTHSVTVDQRPLQVEQLGLTTVGQVISHLQKDNRLVVQVLIDGQEPDLDAMPTVRASPLLGHTVFIETSDPREMAVSVLDEVEGQLAESDRLTRDAVSLLRSNQTVKALEKLRGCFTIWHNAQDSVMKTAELLRIDLGRITVDGRPFTAVLGSFAEQLKLIKQSLEHRDFVSLTDTLVYEMSETSAHWRAAIRSMRSAVGA